MLAIRTLTRLASRATPLYRLSARSITTKAPRLATFSTTKVAFSGLRQPALVSKFSTSIARSAAEEDSVDTELIAKLEAELELEKEMKGFEEMPESVKSFLEGGPFTVNEKPGHEEVELVRTYGNETIHVEFSISDLNLMNNEHLQDEALYDEEASDMPRESSPSSSNKGGKTTSASREPAPEEEEEDDDYLTEEEGASDPTFPAHLSIVIEKPNGGALKISGLAQDGMIIMQNVIHHQNSNLLKSKSAENDYQSEGLYAGPEFGNLDEDLQVLFEKYLDERGINTALALFIPDYIEYKEQKEYLRWLESVKDFVQA